MKITESKIPVAMMILLSVIAILCLIKGEYLGAVGSLLGAQQAWSSRWYLLKLKPSALVE
ncbi:hypothetical protein [Duganella vulcania]|uniref:hypothetical protein n=1 Tax=Duganella vulcania TaxID=2692166 RepID=UPI001372044D|nr:hypothetical protein [Duganella vulcania]